MTLMLLDKWKKAIFKMVYCDIHTKVETVNNN